MKKFFMFLAVAGVMAFSANTVSAQDEQAASAATEVAAPANDLAALTAGAQEVPLHQALKTKFIEGGPGFMALIIICLIIGLALAIERILYLSFSKLLRTVESRLQRKFAARLVVLLQAFSIRVFSVTSRVST